MEIVLFTHYEADQERVDNCLGNRFMGLLIPCQIYIIYYLKQTRHFRTSNLTPIRPKTHEKSAEIDIIAETAIQYVEYWRRECGIENSTVDFDSF